MPAIIRYPSYLVLRIPTRWRLLDKIDLTDSISLWPGKRHEQSPEDHFTFYGCTILYVEKNPPAEQFGPPTWPNVVSYENLREFIHFWSFLTRESWAISAFERGDEPVLLDEPPNEQPSWWDNGPPTLNPRQFPVVNHFLALDQAFAFFKKSGTTKDLAALLLFEPNRYARRIAYDNYHFMVSLIWFVVDALLPPEKCVADIICPKCNQAVQHSHPIENFRTRAERALKNFDHPQEYAELLGKLRAVRGKFVHTVSVKDFPETFYPNVNPDTREIRREVTLGESLEFFESEGLATKSVIVMAHEIAYWLVFNRIFTDLNVWPKLGKLKMVSTG
jgi:hypothetical protein